MKTWNSQQGQSVYDLSIQLYGSIDFIFKIIQDNNLDNLDVLGLAGKKIVFDESLTTDSSVFHRNDTETIIYVTGNTTLPVGGLDTDAGEPIQTDDGDFIVVSG